jgi:F-type H+-transporting ATPase subunit alpha
MIYAGTENLLRNVPLKSKRIPTEYIEFLRSKHPDTMAAIKAGKLITILQVFLSRQLTI